MRYGSESSLLTIKKQEDHIAENGTHFEYRTRESKQDLSRIFIPAGWLVISRSKSTIQLARLRGRHQQFYPALNPESYSANLPIKYASVCIVTCLFGE